MEETVGQVEKLSSNAQAMQKAGDEAIETLKQLDSTNVKTKEAIERIYAQTHTTNESATQIEEITDLLIRDSEEAVETMDAVRDIIDEQSANVEKTGTGFSNVKIGIDHSIASVNMISKSMDKLDDARVKVVDIVQSLTAIADENAASTQETLASVAEVTTSICNISDQATSLKEVADKLDKSINIFQF